MRLLIESVLRQMFLTRMCWILIWKPFKDEWYLDSIAVDPDYQGQGIGGRLLKALPEFVRQDGDTIIGLNVDFANPAAERLYSRHGFKKVGTKKIGDHMYDHMQKPIVTTEPVYA